MKTKSSTGNIRVKAELEPISVTADGTARAAAEIRQDANPSPGNQSSASLSSTAVSKDASRPVVSATTATIRDPTPPADPPAGPAEALIGVWFTGSPAVRHDGIEIAGVQPKGSAADIEIQAGDVILAIDGHFLYTIDELRAELLRHAVGKPLAIRYRHGRLTSENYLILGSKDATPQR